MNAPAPERESELPTEQRTLQDMLPELIAAAEKNNARRKQPVGSVCYSQDGKALEVSLDHSHEYYGEHIKGEGGDISLHRRRDTNKLCGAHLPFYAQTLVIGGSTFPTIEIDLETGAIFSADDKGNWTQLHADERLREENGPQWSKPAGDMPDIFNRLKELRDERDTARTRVAELTKTVNDVAEVLDCDDVSGLVDYASQTYETGQELLVEKHTAQARVAELERERDAAIVRCSNWATKAGEAQGRLEASEMAGTVQGWIERATTAEQQVKGLREALEKIAGSDHSIIDGKYVNLKDVARAALAAGMGKQ